MMSEEKLVPPEEFPFPFKPYSIQLDFMKHLYKTLEEGKLGIFESPTGTGKSLSLICGALCWLRDHEERKRRQLKAAIAQLDLMKTCDGDSEIDWLTQQIQQSQVLQQRQQLQQQLNKILCNDEKLEQLRKRKVKKLERPSEKYTEAAKQRDLNTETPVTGTDPEADDADILLEECLESDTTEDSDPEPEEQEDEESKEYGDIKIYFCSRTHSQLAQFVGEVQRSPYAENIRLVSLASRQNYCINKAVQKLKSLSLINEQCTDMQRKKKGRTTAVDSSGKAVKKSRGSSGCPYLQQKAVERLQEEALLEVQDVEQLVTIGRKLSACPYYGSRAAVRDAQVVVVPYNTLLHKNTRKACGINVTGSVIIIDEAHNLLETISHIHSSEVTGHQLTHAYSQLSQYQDRYRNRFSAANLLHLGQVIFVVGRLIRMLGGKPGCSPVESSIKVVDTKMYTLAEFVLSAEIDNINLYKLLEFCQRSKIAHKLHGFAERYHPAVVLNRTVKSSAQQQMGIRAFLKEISVDNISTPKQESIPASSVSEPILSNPLLPVLGFMEALTNHCSDGRVVCNRQTTVGRGSLKFLLLNPAAHFSSIIKEARAVVLAGGTMQPLDEFRDQLFLSAGGTVERLTEFSCGHVIPPDSILPIALAAGPSGKQLDFSYQTRTTLIMLNELGRILVNVCNVIPAGIVCFFPSYEYEKLVSEHWTKNGVISKLERKKKVFREPRRSGMVEHVLNEYAAHIGEPGSSGAIMFSVVGGKLSEGLNFSDDLGRCVIVVGMPYPNIKSPELQEKMNYLNANVSPTAGMQHYENLCMKAVNQSIGRAVRHRNDYAAVLLLDQRYTRTHTQAALPTWIRTSLSSHAKFGPAFAQLTKFFAVWKLK
ncbi:ATP-dependent DNA helicase DDX11 [Cryptotermes secundus]|uniref:ATP-dependent DNA helicase DDX11 n=2 Tax=Cryptotermes secundus TaxID=105785 RepID=A0A2J7QJI9_9NEOP|nr:ATP-dependent DNA helicase DDX11 isoform X1 [Cryptotermes secundus]PNF28755.1 ATP-dependent DNA helicase DDX11 [Cryptotermes secundus]